MFNHLLNPMYQLGSSEGRWNTFKWANETKFCENSPNNSDYRAFRLRINHTHESTTTDYSTKKRMIPNPWLRNSVASHYLPILNYDRIFFGKFVLIIFAKLEQQVPKILCTTSISSIVKSDGSKMRKYNFKTEDFKVISMLLIGCFALSSTDQANGHRSGFGSDLVI